MSGEVKLNGARRIARTALCLGSVALIAALTAAAPAEPAAQAAQAAKPAAAPRGLTNEVFKNGEAGFVVTKFAYVLGPDGTEKGVCPKGMTGGVRGLVDSFAKSPAGQRKEGETQQAYERRTMMAVMTTPDGKNVCMNPEAASPDPGWRMVEGKNIQIDGLDLDGGKQAGTCSHQEFMGTGGTRGIDNQFYRMIGCVSGYQSTGSANGFDTEMYTGSWGILLTLKGVDDLRNDPEVEVGIHANADPIQLSAARTALAYATYAIDRDPSFRAYTKGRIVNGVLTIDPVDMKFHSFVNGMTDDRILRDGRLRMTFTEDGGLEGFLGGYTPVDAAYDLNFGSRNSRMAKGGLAPLPLRVGTAGGRAAVLGHSCQGAWYALHEVADGHRDPKTGKCTSISTQYRIRVMPAFVVDVPTSSVNQPLALR